MHQPAAPAVHQHQHQHQHDAGIESRACCDLWPPTGRVRTIGHVLTAGRLLHGATYTARVLATGGAVAAVHALLLPATTAWAGAHGLTSRALWTLWAAASLAALYHGVLARRRSRTAVYVLHALTGAAVLMVIAAPGGWVHALAATAGAAVAWLTAVHATYRWHRQPPR